VFERLEITNYQSLKDVDLRLGRFTVIVGPSGRGKSALLRALRALCFNQVDGDFVRHAQQKTTVKLTFDDGHTVVWEKGRKEGAVYELDGKLHTRTGRDVPEAVTKALGIRRIEVDKGIHFAPQFQSQHDAPLLLSDSSTVAARALAKLTKLGVLVEAQMDCRRDGKRAVRDNESATEEATRERAKMKGLPNAARAGKVLRRALTRLKEIGLDIVVVKQAQEIIRDMTGALLWSDVTLPSDKDLQATEAAVVKAEQADAAIEVYTDAAVDVGNERTTLTTAEGKVATLEHEHDALVKKLGACPLCGSTETWGRV
jgi:DNA repair exonuclease SbcCD ATPase subunit